MKPLRQFYALFRRAKLDREMDDELRFHIEERTRKNLAAGMPPDEAALAARKQFGWRERVREEARDARGITLGENLIRDLCFGARMLRKNPGFTLVVALTLAIGIGINTVVFSFYNAVVLKPLAVRAPDEVVRIIAKEGRNSADLFSYAEFEQMRTRAHSLSAVIASSSPQTFSISKSDAIAVQSEIFSARLVSENYFSALGVAAPYGRTFAAGEESVAVLSHEAWEHRFNSDPSVLGSTLSVRDVSVTIIGVAPKNFAGTGRPASAPDIWMPLSLQRAVLPDVDWLHNDSSREWQILGRRQSDAAIAQVAAELNSLWRDASRPNQQALRLSAEKVSLFDAGYLEFQAVSAILMMAVGLILLVACANVVNILAARNASREHEIAVRLAIGASRSRLVRQLCTESVLLGLLGGAGGLLFSLWACELIRAGINGVMRTLFDGVRIFSVDVSPDWRVFAYATGVSLLTGLLVGVWPALRATRMSIDVALKQDRSGVASRGHGRPRRRNLLLSAQVAACLVLLASSGLLFRGAERARDVEPGFDAGHLFFVRVNLQSAAPNKDARIALMRGIADRVRALPEVVSIAHADRPPYFGHSIPPFEIDDGTWRPGCVSTFVSENYFETLGIPLLAGRAFTTQEVEDSAQVVIVSESAALHLWPGKNPIGHRIIHPKLNKNGTHDSFIVVGVVKDARLTLLSKTDDIDLFFPKPMHDLILVRTRSEPERVAQATFALLGETGSAVRSDSLVSSMEKGPIKLQRLVAEGPALVATFLGVTALLLASVGVYGVVSFLVTRRTREIGVHIALGARSGDVIRMVLRDTLWPVVWGAGVGLFGSFCISTALARVLSNPEIPDLTYGAGAFSTTTFASVLGVLSTVILIAALIPARRATRVDPMIALRAE